MGEGTPQRRIEGGTGRCVGDGGRIVKLREWAKRRVCLGKGVVTMRCRCKERGRVQRRRSLVIIDVAVRDRAGGIQAEINFTEGMPELRAHEGVVEAHGGCCVGVGGNIQNGEGPSLYCGLELGKRLHDSSTSGTDDVPVNNHQIKLLIIDLW
jgi:hypothetical protein